MIHTLRNATKRWPVEAILLGALVAALTLLQPNNPANGAIGASALLICLVIGIYRNNILEAEYQTAIERTADEATAVGDSVDVWSYQRYLMEISGQPMANRPEINKTMLLYAAMQAEELSEQFYALEACLASMDYVDLLPLDRPKVTEVKHHFCALGRELNWTYRSIKSLLASMEADFHVPIPVNLAVPLLDGVTDEMVVSAGFSLAAGLPGRESYAETVTSNISKANPETGVIDKDPSGKWIKGPRYVAPNLATVLQRHAAQYRQ